MISLILLIVALVLFILAAVGVGGRFNLIAAGLAFWVAAVILGSGALHG